MEFPNISTRSKGEGPFGHMYMAAQEIQYQRVHNRSAPPAAPSDDILARAQWRDKKIDERSIKFASTAKEHFKCELALALLGASQEVRPLEGHRILSDMRMQKKLMTMMHSLGLFELVPGRNEYTPESPAKSLFEVILEDAPPEQLRSALTERAISLKDRQLKMLKAIRGVEE